jgi:enoyl-[acyl-carrier protein] reductase I
MTLLEGKRLLVTGVLTDRSIAYSVARLAAEQGATVVLSSFGRPMSLTQRVARRLPGAPPVVELDVTSEADLAALADRVTEHVDGLDGVLHAVGFAPPSALGSGLLDTPWEDVGTALQVSCWPTTPPTSGWTSTPASPGRPTTGWAWPRRAWSRPAATWPATSARAASA